ncbi:MAG: hypothetical protein IT292_03400 [Deltaproteobacteria bacterium]|nr:hypothetical protein [Deltaproteobacteria bacterium]
MTNLQDSFIVVLFPFAFFVGLSLFTAKLSYTKILFAHQANEIFTSFKNDQRGVY